MLGIIILNYQTWEISIRCMESIKDTIGEIPYHIYLVDNPYSDAGNMSELSCQT